MNVQATDEKVIIAEAAVMQKKPPVTGVNVSHLVKLDSVFVLEGYTQTVELPPLGVSVVECVTTEEKLS